MITARRRRQIAQVGASAGIVLIAWATLRAGFMVWCAAFISFLCHMYMVEPE